MDVTEPSTPEEVVETALDQLLDEDEDNIDTQVYAENIVMALRAAGFLPDDESGEPIMKPLNGFALETLNRYAPPPSGFHRRRD